MPCFFRFFAVKLINYDCRTRYKRYKNHQQQAEGA